MNEAEAKKIIADLIDPITCEGCTLCQTRTNPCVYQMKTANKIFASLNEAGYRLIPELTEVENIYAITGRFHDPDYMDKVVRDAYAAGSNDQLAHTKTQLGLEK